MDTIQAFAYGQAFRNNEPKVFDWDKAARRIKEENAQYASAGLSQDWEYTGGEIFKDGNPVDKEDTYVYLASTLATPELIIDDGIPEPCYIMQSKTEWNAHTYWPESALKILVNYQDGKETSEI